jgi:hypothetical protein
MSSPIIPANSGAGTYTFSLGQNAYAVVVTAGTWASGSVQLNILGPDGATYVSVVTAWAANTFATLSLPSGSYEIVIASASNVNITLSPTGQPAF